MDMTPPNTKKEQQWQAMAQRFAQMTDRLGKGIDTGILETVIVLNLLKLTTTQSCEGHLEWGTCAPWVHISTPGLQAEERHFHNMMKQADEQKKQGQRSPEEIRDLFAAAHQARRAVKLQHAYTQKKLFSYLEHFYSEHFVPYERRLIVYALGLSTCRMESQGANIQEVIPLEIRQGRLQAYQEEMHALTIFLKDIWLADLTENHEPPYKT